MNDDIYDAASFGVLTLAIGSAMMLLPIKSNWWKYGGLFVLGTTAKLVDDKYGNG